MRLKRIFPRVQQHRVTELTLKHTDEIADELEWALTRFPLVVDEPALLKKCARRYRRSQKQAAAILACEQPFTGFTMAHPLRHYQAQATALYLEQQFLLNADFIGGGKTATAIASFTERQCLPAVVVVQAHLPQQWADEIEKFLPGARTHIIGKMQPYDLPASEVYIISYSKLAAWVEILGSRARSVVFDEIQELRHRGTEKYKAAEVLCKETKFRFGLSATPIYNFGDEVWSVYNILAPDALGSFKEFTDEWCNAVGKDKYSVADPEALGHYLRNRRMMVRRSRKEVGRELPAVTRIVQEVDIDTAAFEKSVGSAEELAKMVLGGTFLEKGQAARKFDILLRQATGLAKAPYVADLARMLLESGEKVIIGGWHHSVYAILRERLKDFNPVMFTGDQTPAQKQESKEAFVSGKTSLMLLSLRSGAGTNGFQDVCSCQIIGELDWTPQVHNQFVGRIARDGQKSPCQVYIPVATSGSDPTIAGVLGLKTAEASGIMDLGNDEDIDVLETSPARVKQLAIDFLVRRGIPVPAEKTESEVAAV